MPSRLGKIERRTALRFGICLLVLAGAAALGFISAAVVTDAYTDLAHIPTHWDHVLRVAMWPQVIIGLYLVASLALDLPRRRLALAAWGVAAALVLSALWSELGTGRGVGLVAGSILLGLCVELAGRVLERPAA